MTVRRPRDEQELAAALALRIEVFCGEQGVTFDGEVIGTCRLLIEPGGTARFGRLCVRASARGSGVGAALLAAAEREARAADARRIGMHAQTGALSLYRRAGFRPYGERFYEEGLEHVGMEKDL